MNKQNDLLYCAFFYKIIQKTPIIANNGMVIAKYK